MVDQVSNDNAQELVQAEHSAATDALPYQSEEWKRLRASFDEPDEGQAAQIEEADNTRGIIADVGLGILDGARDGVQAMIDGVDGVAGWLNDNVASFGGVQIDGNGVTLLNAEEFKNSGAFEEGGSQNTLPDGPETQTMAGGLAKGITQFAVGFMGPGRILKGASAAVKGGKALTFAAKGTETAARAAISDASAFDGHEQRLSDLLQTSKEEFGVDLSNPVSEYLASAAEDSEIEGRFKSAVEGLLLGAGVSGAAQLAKGLFMGTKALKAGRQVKAATEAQQAQLKEVYAADERVLSFEDQIAESASLAKISDNDALNKGIELGVAKENLKRLEGNLKKATKDETKVRLTSEIKTAKEKVDELFNEVETHRKLATDHRARKVEVENALRGELDTTLLGGTYKPKAAAKHGFVNMDENAMREFSEALASRNLDEAAEIIGRDFNFGHMNAPAEFLDSINIMSEKFAGKMDAMKGGAVETDLMAKQKLSRMVGAGEDKLEQVLRETFEGTQNLRTKIDASRVLMMGLHGRLNKEAVRLAGLPPEARTDIMMGEFRKLAEYTLNVQGMYNGVKSNLGRGLRGLGQDVTYMDDLLRSDGGIKATEKLIAKLAADPHNVGRNLQQSLGRRSFDVAVEYYINGLLSGPLTQAVNASSNGVMLLYSPLEDAVSAAIKGNWDNTAEGTTLREVLHGTTAVIDVMLDTVKTVAHYSRLPVQKTEGWDVLENTVKTAWKEKPQLDPGYMTQDFENGAIRAKHFNIDNKAAAMAVDWVGRVIRLPSRALMTSDELFKGINYRVELKRRAARAAMENPEIKDFKAFRDAVNNNVRDPSPELHSMALEKARKNTFTNELEKGSFSRKVQDAVIKHPALRVIMPFVRTPTNILKFYGQRMPLLAPFGRQLRADLASGDPVRVSEATGRMAMGSAFSVFAATLAMDGKITGGGPKEKAHLRQAGWMPYAFVSTDEAGNKTYTQFNRADPFAMFLGVIADIVDITSNSTAESAEEYTELAATASLAVVKNLTSKTYLQGLSDLVKVLEDSDRYGPSYVQRQIGTMAVPNFFNQMNRMDGLWEDTRDPYMREVRSITDAVRARIPGLSDNLPPRRNIYGEPIVASTGTGLVGHGPGILNPFFSQMESNDPVNKEVMRLKFDVRLPQRKIDDIELTPEQYSRYVELAGKDVELGGMNLKQRLRETVMSDHYKSLPDGMDGIEADGRQAMLRQWITAYRKVAKQRLINEEYPELGEALREAKLSKLKTFVPTSE